MASKLEYIAALQAEILKIHGCGTIYLKTVAVHETFQGKTVWKGDVELFGLVHHPKAIHVYAWARDDGGKDEKNRFVTVLEIHPVKHAKAAVQASIIADCEASQS